MMRLISAILVTMPSVTSDCGGRLNLTASNPNVTFETPNYPRRHKAREKCTWVVSAPGNIAELYVTCNLNIRTSVLFFSYAEFYFYNYGEKINLYGTETRSITLKGSTSIFKFKSRMCVNLRYKGVSCTVSYNPNDIPTCTTPVNPNCRCGEKGWKRIIGGKVTTPNEYPWQALLYSKSLGSQFCGGSFISNQWVLSASHCVNNTSPSSILVVLGEHDYESVDSESEYFVVIDIINHENFGKITKSDYDIALLKIDILVVFNEVISPICLPFNYKHYDFTEKNVISTGWGQTVPGNRRSKSKILKQIEQKSIMWSKCTKLDGYVWVPKQITENMICALAQNGAAWYGDSGGPMVWKSDSSDLYFQLGVQSSVGKYGIKTDPTIYTRVSQFVDWIVTKTGAGDKICVKI